MHDLPYKYRPLPWLVIFALQMHSWTDRFALSGDVQKTLLTGSLVRLQGGVSQTARTVPGVDRAANWHEAHDHGPLRGWSNAKKFATLPDMRQRALRMFVEHREQHPFQVTGRHPDCRESSACRAAAPPSKLRVRRAGWTRATGAGSLPICGHAYPCHTTSAATSMMTVSANRSRSHEFMPQNGRAEDDNPRYLGHGSVAVRSVAARITVT